MTARGHDRRVTRALVVEFEFVYPRPRWSTHRTKPLSRAGLMLHVGEHGWDLRRASITPGHMFVDERLQTVFVSHRDADEVERWGYHARGAAR